MKAQATTNVVLPRPLGYVKQGTVVDLDIKAWDLKAYTYLKHFRQVKAPDAPPKGKADPLS